jgi:hypothetical protein
LIWSPFIFLHKSGKAVEAFGPEQLIAIEPFHRLLHRLGGQPARHDATGFGARDQASIRQHVEMLHDRRQRHREWLRQLAHRHRLLPAKLRQQRPPRRVCQRGKGTIENLITILNHMV